MYEEKKTVDEEKKSNYWIMLVVLLCLGWVMIWLYRTIFTPIYPQVMETLGLKTNTDVAYIYSLYFLAYVVFQIPAGIISDRFDKRKVLSFGFLAFAISIFFMSMINVISLFYAFCLLAGVAGAFYYSAAFSLSNSEIPKSKRNVANAIINSGTAIGIVLGLNVASSYVVVNHHNWQTMLAGVAAAVFITAVVFYIVIRDNSRNKKQGKDIGKQAAEVNVEGSYFTPMKLTMYFVLFCSAYAYFMVSSWLPDFLSSNRGFVGGSASLVASLVAIASLPGSLFFGVIVDRFNSKKYIIMVLLLVAAAVTLLLAVYVQYDKAIIACLIIYGFIGKLALDPLLISSIGELSNKYKLATSLSIYNFFGMSASFVAPYVAGRIKDSTGDVVLAFYLACGILVLGAIVLSVMVYFSKKNKPAI